MSVFGSIMSKIFGHPAEPSPALAETTGAPAAAPAAALDAAAPVGGPPAPAAAAAAAQPQVDVQAVLTDMAAKSGKPSNWRTSIVDLMALLGLDHSLDQRKQLAHELGYAGSTDDSATMNVWLHKRVMSELAANGGKVPDDLKA